MAILFEMTGWEYALLAPFVWIAVSIPFGLLVGKFLRWRRR